MRRTTELRQTDNSSVSRKRQIIIINPLLLPYDAVARWRNSKVRDLIWQVTLSSSAMGFPSTAIHNLEPFMQAQK